MSHMQIAPDLAQLSRSIEPTLLGSRLKAARLAAGLTQGELAGEDASTAYVSRIEAGTRRPELGLLVKLAARCKTSLEELLVGIPRNRIQEMELELDYAELDHASGNPQSGLDRIETILSELRGSGADALIRRTERTRALCLEARGRLDEAIVILEGLTSTPEGNEGWLRELIALSRCYREAGDFQRAMATGEQAQKQIEDLDLAGTTEAIQLTITVAAAYIRAGDLGHAMRICLKALDQAERSGSVLGKASAYWNASAVHARQGQTGAALDMAKSALRLFELGEDGRNLARLRVFVADMHLKVDPADPAAALALLDQADSEVEWSAAGALDRADMLLIRARALLLEGHVEDAAIIAGQGRDAAAGVAPLLEAEANAISGQAAAAAGDLDQARTAYRSAVLTLTSVGADRNAAQLWFELGALLDSVGEGAEAREAYRRAAASTGLVNPVIAARTKVH